MILPRLLCRASFREIIYRALQTILAEAIAIGFQRYYICHRRRYSAPGRRRDADIRPR